MRARTFVAGAALSAAALAFAAPAAHADTWDPGKGGESAVQGGRDFGGKDDNGGFGGRENGGFGGRDNGGFGGRDNGRGFGGAEDWGRGDNGGGDEWGNDWGRDEQGGYGKSWGHEWSKGGGKSEEAHGGRKENFREEQHVRPRGGVHAGGGGMASNGGGLAAGGVLLAGGLGAGAWSLRRRGGLGRAI